MPENILIISFYYPPYTGIEGNRIHSWANSLAADGFKVTVITRQWKAGGQNTWQDYYSEYKEGETSIENVTDNLRVIRLPYQWNPGFKKYQATRFTSIYYWYNKLAGILHPETDAYHAFKNYADRYLSENKVDFLIVSSPPLNIIRLGHELKAKHGVHFIADFRDSFNNKLMQQSGSLTLKEKAEAWIFRRHIRKWLNNADGVTSVSKAVLNTIHEKFQQPTALIMNGYEKDLFDNVPRTEEDGKFKISLVGNLYPQQEIGFMAKGIRKFIDKIKPRDLVVQFIGIKWKQVVVEKIKEHIPEEYLYISDRLPRQEAVSIMKNSQLLLQVGWKGYLGFCPGKVFEYMAAGKNILIAPADGDLTDSIIKETATGYSAHTIEEVADYLERVYEEWKQTGAISYNGKPGSILQYTRENQNRILSEFLRSFIQSNQKIRAHAVLRTSDSSN